MSVKDSLSTVQSAWRDCLIKWIQLFMTCMDRNTEENFLKFSNVLRTQKMSFSWLLRTGLDLILLAVYFSTSECWNDFVLVICRPFQRQNWGHNSLWVVASVVKITWRHAGALQIWVGLTLDNCKKVEKRPIRRHFEPIRHWRQAALLSLLLKYTWPLICGDWGLRKISS